MLARSVVRGRRSRLTTLIAVVALAAFSLAGAPAAAAAAPAAPSAHVHWAPCEGGVFQCATVSVPLDYDRPNGASILLSLIRLRATNPGQRIGSLLVNPGGPGGSGVDLVLSAGQFFPPEIRARFDLVGFDPRGIARSTPLRCFGTPRQWGRPSGRTCR
jgi:pimeloyl-ACP methyl ester carboxylesterase